MKDYSVVFDHFDRYGEPAARLLFSNQLVNEAQHLSANGSGNPKSASPTAASPSKSSAPKPPSSGHASAMRPGHGPYTASPPNAPG
ncbi:hypothetical protein ACFV2C_16085 [[Kitasatospora] papulosa]|uniref:hypothetical protein n=1 Tax=[Kitasatospora] papulosa TaxID=1464011 RepID=UPI0036B7AF47